MPARQVGTTAALTSASVAAAAAASASATATATASAGASAGASASIGRESHLTLHYRLSLADSGEEVVSTFGSSPGDPSDRA